jgi:hypothetical protein
MIRGLSQRVLRRAGSTLVTFAFLYEPSICQTLTDQPEYSLPHTETSKARVPSGIYPIADLPATMPPNGAHMSLAECDLAAQQSMASSATSMNRATWASAAVGLLTLLGLGATIYYARRAVVAANEATRVQREIFEEERAPF